ncbi:MAG: recombinase family protein [Eubacteriales bacterium]
MENTARQIIEIKATVPSEDLKLRVAAYARVSSDSEEQLNSFQNQTSYYKNFVEEKENWNLVGLYADEGISGVSSDKRVEFKRLLEDCRDGKIDRVITKSVSRFARNTLDSIETLRELKSLGVTVLFEKEGIDTGKLSSENLITLHANFAQEESLNISRNCKKGIRMKMEKGIYTPTSAPYGYQIQDKQLVIVNDEAQIVKRIFSEYLSGKGGQEIARTLNQEKIPKVSSAVGWRANTIIDILRNERYIGDSLWQKKYSLDVLPYTRKRNKGDIPQYYAKNTHEAIVSNIVFELANILLNERASLVKKELNDTILAQKIRCKNCGLVYRYRKTKDKIYWVCRKHDESAKDCDSHRIREELIYRAFVNLYNKLRNNYKTILVPLQNSLEKLQLDGKQSNEDVQAINKKIADLTEQNLNLSALMSQGILDSTLFVPQIDAIKKEMAELKRRKKRFISKLDQDDRADKIGELIATLKQGPSTISKFHPELFEEMVDHIIAFDKEKIEFVLYGGLILEERL